MAGSETIVQRILEQAREQAQAMEQETRSQSQADGAVLLKQAEEQAAAILLQSKSDMAERERRIVAVADLELRKRVLAAKREVLDEAYAMSAQRLAGLEETRYVEVYLRLVTDAIVKGSEVIAPAQADQARLGEGFVALLNEKLRSQGRQANVTLGQPRADMPGGCIVMDGGMEINFSHAAVMRNLREATEADTARMLFEDGEG